MTKRYGRTRALDGLDLVLEAGAPIALVGPNGAGKTTLLSLLAGFVRPSGGTVEVLGERPGSAALGGRVGALPQDALFDPRLSVGHQLRVLAELQGFDRRAARTEASRVLGAVGLDDVERRRPTALSHGMRKRVALAQALIGEPVLVLLDEPTAGIDPENARAIRELILERGRPDASPAAGGRERRRGTTFVVSSHNLDELERLCGTVVQLERGALVRQERLDPDGAAASTTSSPAVASRNGATVTSSPAVSSANGAAVRSSPDPRPGGTGESVVRDVGTTGDGAPAGADELTVRLGDVPSDAFAEAAAALGAVHSLRPLPDGDWRLACTDATLAAAELLALLGERGWPWRRIVRGRSLEERLYGR